MTNMTQQPSKWIVLLHSHPPCSCWLLALFISISSPHLAAQIANNDVRVPGAAAGEWFRNGQSVKFVGENVRGGISNPEQMLTIEGPLGKAAQFSDYYFWLPMRQNPPGLGKTWTASMWVRVDDGDWGVYRLPWSSDTNMCRKFSTVHQVLVSVQAAPKSFWQLRVFNQRLEFAMNNAWTVMGSTRFVPGRWTHVAAVRGGDKMRIFIDGKLERLQAPMVFDRDSGTLVSPAEAASAAIADGKIPEAAEKPPGASAMLILGNQHDDAAPYGGQFVGAIGAFSLIDRILSESELAQAAAKGEQQADTLSQRYSVLVDPVGGVSARVDKSNETPEQYQKRMAWWHQGKYGLFMHWNPSSVGAMEVSWGRQDNPERYDGFYKEFNPTRFNPTQWAEEAKQGGFKYMVWTAKHHDGFTMWPSKTTDYNVSATPYKKDIVAQYVQAVRAAKMPVGIYFSPRDWLWERLNGDPGKDKAKRAQFVQCIRSQLMELCSSYGPLDVLWFDGGIGGEADMARDIVGKYQANSVANDRNGPGDHLTPEGRTPPRPLLNHDGSDALWETCNGMGNGGWSYHFDAVDEFDGLIREMIEIFAKGGNLLRNIGPRPTGEWSPQARERIAQIGQWLAKNGDSVYGAHRTRLGKQSFGWTTANDSTLFLHVLSWPKNGSIRLEGLFDKVDKVNLLDGGKELSFQQKADVLSITLPAAGPDTVNTVIACRIKK